MTRPRRTSATCFLYGRDILQSLEKLKFAIKSLVQLYDPGSYEKELADNAVKGIDGRLDYLLDSIEILIEEREAASAKVTQAMTK